MCEISFLFPASLLPFLFPSPLFWVFSSFFFPPSFCFCVTPHGLFTSLAPPHKHHVRSVVLFPASHKLSCHHLIQMHLPNLKKGVMKVFPWAHLTGFQSWRSGLRPLLHGVIMLRGSIAMLDDFLTCCQSFVLLFVDGDKLLII